MVERFLYLILTVFYGAGKLLGFAAFIVIFIFTSIALIFRPFSDYVEDLLDDVGKLVNCVSIMIGTMLAYNIKNLSENLAGWVLVLCNTFFLVAICGAFLLNPIRKKRAKKKAKGYLKKKRRDKIRRNKKRRLEEKKKREKEAKKKRKETISQRKKKNKSKSISNSKQKSKIVLVSDSKSTSNSDSDSDSDSNSNTYSDSDSNTFSDTDGLIKLEDLHSNELLNSQSSEDELTKKKRTKTVLQQQGFYVSDGEQSLGDLTDLSENLDDDDDDEDDDGYEDYEGDKGNEREIMSSFNDNQIKQYVIQAIKAFFKSISLSSYQMCLQDTLRILTLYFRYGTKNEVIKVLTEGFETVSISTWLLVIPQLIARIHTPINPIRKLLHDWLIEIGKIHPQALIYPLTVAFKSQSEQKKRSKEMAIKNCKKCRGKGCTECLKKNSDNIDKQYESEKIMETMKYYSPNLVKQAELVSQELIKVATLWKEMWYDGLEEASRLYFVEKNINGMLNTLQPMHDLILKGPKTRSELKFAKLYGPDLNEAKEYCARYIKSKNRKNLTQAWKLYYLVFKKIAPEIPKMSKLNLLQVSHELYQQNNLELAVPGTYRPNEDIIRIQKFHHTLVVMGSKQRPRKFKIFGNDGLIYKFLLKGHEDLRQDERVMQLFGLVNTLLSNYPETSKRNLSIQRYAVVPLSPNNGLIGWVPHSDTVLNLIKEYRNSIDRAPNLEHQFIFDEIEDYEKLSLMQKLELFKLALDLTDGQDLAQILWLKSQNSEVWLDRRTNYTRSLAVMSMVGYILGLGDRHPSNLMMNRSSGKIIHIDLGDCFEVAMQREKFPEKIPFRLTRMLVNAMEISKTEGNFRHTCLNSMKVIRDNKDSLMALLEAFVYDPLINWFLDRESSQTTQQKLRKMVKAGSGFFYYDSYDQSLNEEALKVIERISNKLTGRDFNKNETLSINNQVDRLIQQSTSNENLSQCYIGWCPFW
eukprot:Anaeramoba_flamelloidesa326854_59.p1 GENE.a326854_59~~a326854_59.p1  ORF type:complete len:975 (+),score=216.26 a326854_59:235-3159(+)